VGYVLGALFFGRYLRRSRTNTLAEFFGQRFNSKRVQVLAGITMYSGSRGVILTDTLMFLLFTVASAAAVVFLVRDLGGVPSIIEDLVAIEQKKDLMSWHGMIGPGTDWPTAMDYLIWAIVIDISWMLVYMVSPWQSSRHQMARNEHVVLRSAVIAALFVALLQVLVYGMGGIINVGNPEISPPERATIWASLHMLPTVLGALMLAGIMAAVLSSASTFLSLVGFSVSNDIGIHDTDDETKSLRFSRLMMLVTGAAALAAALVFNVVPKFFTYIGVLELPSYLNPVIIGGLASLLVTMVVSRRTTVSTAEKVYLAKLHERPESEVGQRRTRITLLAPAVLIAVNGVVLPVLLTVYYVLPYQRATGTLAPGGSLDWATGEMALMVSWSVIWIALGIFAIRYILKAYAPTSRGP